MNLACSNCGGSTVRRISIILDDDTLTAIQVRLDSIEMERSKLKNEITRKFDDQIATDAPTPELSKHRAQKAKIAFMMAVVWWLLSSFVTGVWSAFDAVLMVAMAFIVFYVLVTIVALVLLPGKRPELAKAIDFEKKRRSNREAVAKEEVDSAVHAALGEPATVEQFKENGFFCHTCGHIYIPESATQVA